MKIMVSQPMGNLEEKEILFVFNNVKKRLEKHGHTVVTAYFKDYCEECLLVKNKPLYCLADSLKIMSDCDGVYFVDGWENARGCRIEHQAAEEYGLKIMYSDILNIIG